MENPDKNELDASPAAGEQQSIYGRHRWVPFVLPLLVFSLTGYFEPQPPPPEANSSSVAEHDSAVDTPADDNFFPYSYYPWVYAGRILLTLVAVAAAAGAYRSFPLRVSWLSPVCGILGVVVWVAICRLELERQYLLPALGGLLGEGDRAAYNPFEQLGDRPAALAAFLAVRFLGLALVVPLIEEFFLRGFLLRFVQDTDWWKLSVGTVNAAAWVAVIVYAVLTHPGEMIAAVAWFSLVTWLVVRTNSIWDAVVAHAVTNLLLGLYVIAFGQWQLW